MAANTITKRVTEFLVQFPPFDRGSKEDLRQISSSISIHYLEAGELVFKEGEGAKDHFFVVRQGSVMIFHEKNNGELVDICDEGDIFGVRPLLTKENYLASAKTQEECLLYAIPLNIGREILNRNAKIALFFAMGYASGKPMQRQHITQEQTKQEQKVFKQKFKDQDINEVTTPNYPTDVLTCQLNDSIELAAQKMANRNIGSIIIAEQGIPKGIITDNDLRNKIATGKVERTEKVTSIMSSPIKAVAPNISVAECMIEMINLGVHHLCVTKDGSPDSQLVGIISDHDLLLVQGNNPAIIIKEIKKAASVSEMIHLRNRVDELTEKYLDQEISMHFIRKMTNAVNDALHVRLIELTIQDNQPPCSFAWINLGSSGREEQLLRTDQDHALIFEKDSHREFFLNLASTVSKQLEKLGFEQDTADIGANNVKWCQPLEQWKSYFNTWVHQPDEDNILLSNIFFDYRVIYGNYVLAEELAEHLYKELETEQIFLPKLAKNALTNPAPLSFFRNFLVEKSGEHKDDFDLKSRAMLPLTDAARVLCLHHHIKGVNNTAERYIKASEIDKANASLLKEAAHGYEILMRLRGKFGFKNNDSGRYIQIGDLNKLDRQTLRNIFSIISELQKILTVRFQLNYLG